MYYELYIDVFFIENFLLDTMLLITLKKIMMLRGSYLRVMAGGFLGAALSSVVMCVQMNSMIKYILVYVVIPMSMLVVSYRIYHLMMFLRMLCILYLLSIMLGGILMVIRPRIENIITLCVCSLAGNYFIIKAWKIFTARDSVQKNVCEVIIHEKAKSVRLIGMIDTGNVLRDPMSGDPVCIVDRDYAEKIFGRTIDSGIRFVPFHTVGNNGIIPIKRAEKMMIQYNQKKYRIEKPLIGICKEKICTNEQFQIILNRDILGGTKYAIEGIDTK